MKRPDEEGFPFGEIEVDPGFEIDEDEGDDFVAPTKAERKRQKALRKKEANAALTEPGRFAVVTLVWDRTRSSLSIDHEYVSFAEACGVVLCAEVAVRESMETGGALS